MGHDWVIIPGYNEQKHISKVVQDTFSFCDNVIVVDDGSTDDTSKNAGRAIVLRHIVNLGKGAALRTGVEYAISRGAKRIVFLDSDGQHDPAMIPEFLENLKHNDIVFGYRKLSGKMPFVLRFGNWFINTVTSILFSIRLKDTQSGYRAFNTEIYEDIKWNSADYSVETEIIANVGRKKLKYKEIPIATIYADKYKGTTVLDGIKIVMNMIIWRFTR